MGSPNIEQLNAIFRAAHSIKGGAATFGCFTQLAGTTHLLENLLDAIRRGEMALRTDMVDIFWKRKTCSKPIDAYRASEEPDEAVFERICAVLRQLALEIRIRRPPRRRRPRSRRGPRAAALAPEPEPALNRRRPRRRATAPACCVRITKVSDKDAEALLEEMGNLGQVRASERANGTLTVWSTAPARLTILRRSAASSSTPTS